VADFPLPVRGQKTIVLGSTSGIGRATALLLAESGADVIIHGRSSLEAAHEVAESCRAFGVRSEVIMADLADPIACDRLLDEAWNLWNGLDSWLHLAGADTLTGPNAKLPFEAKLDLLWKVDVVSTLRLCREVGNKMKLQGQGSIVTMGWDQAETGMEGDSGELFATIKGAIMSFTRSLAISLAPQVRVNNIAPGWIKTSWGDTASPTWHDRAVREAPLARWGTPLDVATMIRFMISPDSAFLTGQILRANGGAVRA
jgi:3-oxoacyl-[acyl-carrier protein] reductase